MQTLGTEWGRDLIHPNIWLHAWKQLKERSGARLVVVDDVRFQNEMDLVRSMGGAIYHVSRPGHEQISLSDHASEISWKDGPFDGVLYNTADFEWLSQQLDIALSNSSDAFGVKPRSVPAE